MISKARKAARRILGITEERSVDPRYAGFDAAVRVLASHPHPDLAAVEDPVSYVGFVAGCLQRSRYSFRVTKGGAEKSTTPGRRLATLVSVLQSAVPSVEQSTAREIAVHLDRLRSNRAIKEFSRWAGDIGVHALVSSSDARKGRLLATVARLMRPRSCLELGTCYGVSAMFILSELERLGEGGKLVTMDFSEPQYGIASEALSGQYGGSVTCHKLDIDKHLSEVAASIAPIDLVFHDANHTGENYIRDFEGMEPSLAAGAILVLDDLRWSDESVADAVGSYQGWLKIVSHPRVRFAAVIDSSIGLLQVS